jgi:hypothetical protein
MVGRRVRVCRGCECEAAALGGWEGRRAGKEAWCFILGDGLRVRVYSTIEMGCEVSSGRDHGWRERRKTRLIFQWAGNIWASLSEPISAPRSCDMGLNPGKTFELWAYSSRTRFKQKKKLLKKYFFKRNLLNKQIKLLYIQVNRKQHIFLYSGYLCEMSRMIMASGPLKQKD